MLPDYAKIQQGTSLQWKGSGGDYVLTSTGLVNGGARAGESCDLTSIFDEEYLVELTVECASAPTAGDTISLFLCSASAIARLPGGVSGDDEDWPTDGNEDEWGKQLGMPVLILKATNDGSGTLQTQQGVIWRPQGRFIVPVLDNNLGVALAAGNNTVITLTPRRLMVQDAA